MYNGSIVILNDSLTVWVRNWAAGTDCDSLCLCCKVFCSLTAIKELEVKVKESQDKVAQLHEERKDLINKVCLVLCKLITINVDRGRWRYKYCHHSTTTRESIYASNDTLSVFCCCYSNRCWTNLKWLVNLMKKNWKSHIGRLKN